MAATASTAPAQSMNAWIAGFGVGVGDGWAAPGLISSLRKVRLTAPVRHVDVQTLTEVNTMLFRILATPER